MPTKQRTLGALEYEDEDETIGSLDSGRFSVDALGRNPPSVVN